MLTLKSVRPSVCINPGFLSQIHLYYERQKYWAEYSLIAKNPIETLELSNHVSIGNKNRYTKCKACRTKLFPASAIVLVRSDTSTFIEENIDDYWKDFKPIHAYSRDICSVLSKELVYISPVDWVFKTIATQSSSAGEVPLCCPGCSAPCGTYRSNALALCDGFVLVDKYAFYKAAIR
jgi:hypothetical protein